MNISEAFVSGLNSPNNLLWVQHPSRPGLLCNFFWSFEVALSRSIMPVNRALLSHPESGNCCQKTTSIISMGGSRSPMLFLG